MSRHGLLAFLISAAALGRSTVTFGAETPEIVLRSGKVLHGKVVGESRQGAEKLLEVETEYGRILVPAAEVKRRDAGAAGRSGAPRRFTDMRIVEIAGDVKRRAAGSAAWEPLFDSYRRAEDGPYDDIRPGDSVRTGPDGKVAFLFQRMSWIRLAPGTEIEIPASGEWSVEIRAGGMEMTAGEGTQAVRVRTGTSTVGLRAGQLAVSSGPSGATVTAGAGDVSLGSGEKLAAGSTAELADGRPASLRPATDEERSRTSGLFMVPPPDDFVYVPGGSYDVGHRAGTPLPFPMNGDRGFSGAATVRVEPFLISRTVVPAIQFVEFAAFTKRRSPGYAPGYRIDADLAARPALGLSWKDANDFARACGLRLPTHDEWDVAVLDLQSTPLASDRWSENVDFSIDEDAADAPKLWRSQLELVPHVSSDEYGVTKAGLVGPPSGGEFCADWVEQSRWTDPTPFTTADADSLPRPAQTWKVVAKRLQVRPARPEDVDPRVGFRMVRRLH